MITKAFMRCEECEFDIFQCDRCGKAFEGNETIYCIDKDHYCLRCGELVAEEREEAHKEQFIKEDPCLLGV